MKLREFSFSYMPRIAAGAMLLLAVVLVAVAPARPHGKPKTKGVYYDKATLVSEGKNCKADSGAGIVLRMDRDHENPLFESKLPNRIHLLLWLPEGVPSAGRIQLPSPQVQVCYWEQGDLLMFHTTKAMGWIEFAATKSGGPVQGSMEMKLVEPDHNMSNSDYHFLGGAFSFAPAKLPGQ